jgi:formamidopyrimidine-DNA glycosylase
MPELPEVETVRRGLAKLVLGRTIAQVVFDWPKGFPNSQTDVNTFVIGAKIVSVQRRAKVLILDLDSGYSLIVHLKMTGQLVFTDSQSDDLRFGAGHPSDSLINNLPDTSTRVTITFRDESKLFFNDQRKFGWMKLLPTATLPDIPFFQKVGPEPLDASFTADRFVERFQRRQKTSIKAALLDQTVIAGIGNIYADESLWAARIHPNTRVVDVTNDQLNTLFSELRLVLNTAIKKGGSTNKNYVNAQGKKGSYMDFANVFRREGQPCLRCQSSIDKIRVAGRGTHICSNCQVLPT